ncbi:hypothetical protein SAMN04487770_12648 [Butyrivibrio sp. ob235]|nr:hypothetical protein SAMN04487770_12648 [Butyrivibrio sp. ob235]
MLNSNTRKLLSVINKYDCIGRGPFYFFCRRSSWLLTNYLGIGNGNSNGIAVYAKIILIFVFSW